MPEASNFEGKSARRTIHCKHKVFEQIASEQQRLICMSTLDSDYLNKLTVRQRWYKNAGDKNATIDRAAGNLNGLFVQVGEVQSSRDIHCDAHKACATIKQYSPLNCNAGHHDIVRVIENDGDEGP
jgi:hypothetical protein